MTAKEKAEDLIDSFHKCMPFKDLKLGSCLEDERLIQEMELLSAKQCALIAVDEIINTNALSEMLDYGIDKTNLFYWQEVKQEIEKL